MVALQIRHVPEEIRDVLSAEAERRGESLQNYLLEVVAREASSVNNRRLVRDWMARPLASAVAVDVPELLGRHRRDRERHLAKPTVD
ncbi:hypothetical protein MLP_43730 [Microlunatus phosphovorus NM-1]|uniref:Arc-like DNA binding domain-containing protein n=1 Tax=Microlunatus phosphovorus (strain ATCC 700054 / DSM 10555 / JCM 9379 / NBRC 101784 / NCIMB 13414 / VKM Ac-1990 / NM-1) TaxID=1032480 RepID=F5XSX9_MICPN|nr:hypothetical protein [Microlunatus phosphovorus]BAK37387.1 hypothetical protein MLP_43730 [Microlunatus phosphovorus NM-1]